MKIAMRPLGNRFTKPARAFRGQTSLIVFVGSVFVIGSTAVAATSTQPPVNWFLGGHAREINQVAYSPDNYLLASASDDGTVKIWRLYDRTLLRTLTGHRDDVRSVSFSPDSNWLASASEDATVRIWRTADWTLARNIDATNRVQTVSFSPDSTLLAWGTEAGDIQLVRTSDWAPVRQITLDSEVQSLAFSPNGLTIAAGTELPSKDEPR